MLQAILLDRDGVINRERADYVKSWDEFELLPGAMSALQQLSTLQVPVIVITNQSVIGRGLVQAETIAEIHARLCAEVETAGGRIDAFYVCPHHPDEGCSCRKPKPGLLVQAACEFNVDLPHCVFVGDSLTDWQASRAAGCKFVLVRSGRQGQQLDTLLCDEDSVQQVRDLSAAASEIITGFRDMT